MSAYPMVRIVDAPEVDAEVLYDCNDATVPGVESYVEHDGFSIGVPQMLGDPDGLAVDWDLRTLKVPVVIHGAKAAALACQSRLARVLLRRRFWVFVQLDAATAPVWWHGYRSQPAEVPFEQVYVDDDDQFVTSDHSDAEPLPDTWQIALTISADPWGYLERRVLPPLTMGNEPSVADPPAYRVSLPAVDGEALARPRLELDVGQNGLPASWAIIAVHGLPDPVTVRGFGADDTWEDYFVSGDTPASTTPTDAAYLGGSYRQRLVDAELRVRFVDTQSLAVGRYRVFLRLAAAGVSVGLGQEPTTLQVGVLLSDFGSRRPTLTTVRLTGTEGTYYPKWVDCGTEAVGLAGLPADVRTAAVPTPLSVHAALSAGPARQVRFDALMLVRIDGTTRENIDADSLTTRFATTADLATVVDSDSEAFWKITPDGMASTAGDANTSGGFPTLDPTRTNTLVVIPLDDLQNDGAPHVGARTATRTVGGSVQPQVLWLGDGQPNPLTQDTQTDGKLS